MNNPSLTIDNLAFAKKGDHLSGQLAVSSCTRLLDLLQSQALGAVHLGGDKLVEQVIRFEAVGELDVHGRSLIHLDIDANLNTYCQRCLALMVQPLHLQFHYLISDQADKLDGDGFLDESDELDLQEPNQSMCLADLIEDELIMAMPIAPMHDADCAKLSMQAGEKPNPFAVLKGLIKS